MAVVLLRCFNRRWSDTGLWSALLPRDLCPNSPAKEMQKVAEDYRESRSLHCIRQCVPSRAASHQHRQTLQAPRDPAYCASVELVLRIHLRHSIHPDCDIPKCLDASLRRIFLHRLFELPLVIRGNGHSFADRNTPLRLVCQETDREERRTKPARIQAPDPHSRSLRCTSRLILVRMEHQAQRSLDRAEHRGSYFRRRDCSGDPVRYGLYHRHLHEICSKCYGLYHRLQKSLVVCSASCCTESI